MCVGMPSRSSRSVAQAGRKGSSSWLVLAMVYSLTLRPVSQKLSRSGIIRRVWWRQHLGVFDLLREELDHGVELHELDAGRAKISARGTRRNASSSMLSLRLSR